MTTSTSAPPQRPVRLTLRGRILVVMALVLLALVAFGMGRASASDGSRPAPAVRHVTVEPGQTLWDIAREMEPERDPRETVVQLLDLNSLTAPVVRAGQQLAVPLGH